MMEIKEIMIKVEEQIGEEIHDAKEYAKKALMCRNEYPELADLFYTLSGEECRHADMLRDRVNSIAAKCTDSKDVFDYLRSENIENMEKVKRYLSMYAR